VRRQAKGVELPAQLGERRRVEAPAEQGAEVGGAQVHLHRLALAEREGQEANGADVSAQDAGAALGAEDQRLGVALGERLLTVGTARQAVDAVPLTALGAAAAARVRLGNAFQSHHAQAVHVVPLRRGGLGDYPLHRQTTAQRVRNCRERRTPGHFGLAAHSRQRVLSRSTGRLIPSRACLVVFFCWFSSGLNASRSATNFDCPGP